MSLPSLSLSNRILLAWIVGLALLAGGCTKTNAVLISFPTALQMQAKLVKNVQEERTVLDDHAARVREEIPLLTAKNSGKLRGQRPTGRKTGDVVESAGKSPTLTEPTPPNPGSGAKGSQRTDPNRFGTSKPPANQAPETLRQRIQNGRATSTTPTRRSSERPLALKVGHPPLSTGKTAPKSNRTDS